MFNGMKEACIDTNEALSLETQVTSDKFDQLALVLLSEEEIVQIWYDATNDAINDIIDNYHYLSEDKNCSEEDKADFLRYAKHIESERPQNKKIASVLKKLGIK